MARISTSDLSGLPLPVELKRLFQSLAVLDAIMSPEWQYRYYSFDVNWSHSATMGSMRNGSGDEIFALFNQSGCFLKGFSHEHWADNLRSGQFYANVPAEFSSGVSEPAFTPEHVTFCLWATYHDRAWQRAVVTLPTSDDPDGSNFLLSGLDGRPETYQRFARDYYEVDIPIAPVTAVYNHTNLTSEIIQSLNSALDLPDLIEDLSVAGYPAK